ncbi:MAG: hypothetical protein QM764_09705 [Chitinophagaceae bacterium]
MRKILTIGIMALLILFACSKSKETTGGGTGEETLDCNTVTAKSFSNDVSVIIETKCATDGNCHGSGSGNGPGALLNYTAIFNARVQIRDAVASGRMPLTGSITTAQKNSILCWIDGGAPNN